jgi:hypothetical protein
MTRVTLLAKTSKDKRQPLGEHTLLIGQAAALEARTGEVKVTSPDGRTKVFSAAKLLPRNFPDFAKSIAECFGVEDDAKLTGGRLTDQISNLFQTGD